MSEQTSSGTETKSAGITGVNGAGCSGKVSAESDNTAQIVTLGAIGIGVALIEASLIPGMLIGVALVLAPKVLPNLGEGLKPLFKSTVRGAYKVAQQTREAVAEAGEQVQDLVAEAKAEEEAEAKVKAEAEKPRG